MVLHRMVAGRILFWAGISAAVAVAGLAGFLLGQHQSEVDRERLGIIGERIRILELENEEAHRQLADANLAHEVERQVLEIQRDEMTELQGSIRDLREQLAFYRRLMDDSSLQRGLEIAELEIVPGDRAGVYRFRLLLTRPADQGERTSGTLTLDLGGVQAGEERTLSLSEISEWAAYPLEFRFRYFQRLSGTMTLPEGFSPLRVTVKLALHGERATEVERIFDWPAMPD